ncbi:MAG TPA: hypothetical protein ENN30_02355, partial [Candidatus Woesearchaeota archaeon]|nr:hypothetical protein [Candidatus Woesearchaeota archaeon]
YESEDLEKVRKAFELVFPKNKIKQSSADGGYGTKIKILRAELPRKQAVATAEKLLKNISKKDRLKLLSEVGSRLDDTGNFFMRFDKQAAFAKNKLEIADESDDTIQIILGLKTFPACINNYIETVKEILL